MGNNISLNKMYYTNTNQLKNTKPINQYAKKSNNNKYNYLSYSGILPLGVAGGVLANRKINNTIKKLTKSNNNIADKYFETKESQFRDKVLSTFSDLVLNEKEGLPMDMPNCLMVTGDDPKYCERMINWIGKTSNAEYKTIKVGDDVLMHLELAEENYKKTGNRTLLYVKNFEHLINHSQAQDWQVEAAKDIMSAAAEDYHSTIIFQSQDPSKLDSIALQPHRVRKKFSLNEIKEADFFETDSKINLFNKQAIKLKELPKTKNKKIVQAVFIGVLSGAAVGVLINYAKDKLFNKSKK